jgi:hypothetical protein
MLRIEFGHLMLLAALLSPGVVSGVIVSWKIRSPLALFFTIGSSLTSSFTSNLLGLLLWPLISPFVAHLFPHSLIDIRSDTFRLFLASTGLISGAVLSGMLLLVDHDMKRSGKRFNFSSVIVAGVASSTTSSIISLLSLLAISFIMTFILRFLVMLFGDFGAAAIGIIVYGILGLSSIVLCGFISAISGIKIANFLK